MPYGEQLTLDGDSVFTTSDGRRTDPTRLTDRERVLIILDRFPESRNCDKLLIYYYWKLFSPFDEYVSPEAQASLLRFLQDSRSKIPETIRRRRQEIHQLRTDLGILRPSPEIMAYRRAQDKSGTNDTE